MPREATSSGLATCVSERLIELSPAERVGVDAVHIPTWERHLHLGGTRLLSRVYSGGEIAFCAGRVERLATRLAAKEAVLKVLGTGIRGVGLSDVEVVSSPAGRPSVELHGLASRVLAEEGLGRIEISLCHEHEYALAVAVGVRQVDDL
jgi:holo-[acyl-carrier protein] synthase